MRDRLGGHESRGHHRTEEIVLAGNAKARRTFARKGVGGYKVGRYGVSATRVVFACVVKARERGQALRDPLPRGGFVPLRSGGGVVARIRYDRAAFGSGRHWEMVLQRPRAWLTRTLLECPDSRRVARHPSQCPKGRVFEAGHLESRCPAGIVVRQ